MVKYLMKTDKYRKLITTGDYDKNKEIPIILAIRNENFDILNCLLQSNSSSYYSNRYNKTDVIYALVMAINNNKISIVKSLIENKNHGFTIKIDEKYHDNSESAISAAIKNENRTIMDYLLNYGANINQNSYYYVNYKCNLIDILSIAINCNKLSMIKYLLENDGYSKYIDVNSRNKNDKYPISLAINNKSIEIIEYLLNHGISNTNSNNYYSSYNNYNKETLINVLNQAIKKNSLTVVKYVMNLKFNYNSKIKINDKDSNDEMPIYLSIINENIEITEFLLTNEIKTNLRSNGWYSSSFNKNSLNYVLNIAIKNQKLSVIKYLIESKKYENYIEVNNNGNDSSILCALNSCNVEIVDYLLYHGVKLVDSNGYKRSINYGNIVKSLNNAIQHGKLKVVTFIIETSSAYANIEATDPSNNNESPLSSAIQYENLDILDYLLNYNANLNSKNYNNNNINNKNNNNNSDIPQKCELLFVLNIAVKKNIMVVIKHLFENKNYNTLFNGNNQDKNGENPMMLAINHGHIEIIIYLLNHGVSLIQLINDKNISLGKKDLMCIFSLAIKNKNIFLVKYLIENKHIHINDHDENNNTLIMLALNNDVNANDADDIKRNKEIIQYLQDQGASIASVFNKNETISIASLKDNPLITIYKAISKKKNGNKNDKDNKKMFQSIINSHYFDMNERDKHGKTLLFYAIENNDIDNVNYLIHHNTDVNIKNNQDQSPLEITIKNKADKIILSLIESPNILLNERCYDKDETVLTLIIKSQLKQAVKLTILEKLFKCHSQININQVNGDDKSPLYYSIQGSMTSIVRYLIDHGANVNETFHIDKSKKKEQSLLIRALEINNFDIIKLLIENQVDVNYANSEGITFLSEITDRASKKKCEKNIEIFKYCAERIPQQFTMSVVQKLIFPNANFNLLKLLIENQWNINQEDHQNHTILDYVREHPNEEIQDYLISKGAKYYDELHEECCICFTSINESNSNKDYKSCNLCKHKFHINCINTNTNYLIS
ncbi:ankyrin [Neocallimastix californiae]|uniref:Ankyrin n=1 Tax=Neocallimastix californiae TaxID=1754190 RepID=A0A1Y2FKV0_9FUNG|nr:ankyrin [Neocallimastix californiae]|eukprot:ORY84612.1 ankyrin [Neocallimastix californiae]